MTAGTQWRVEIVHPVSGKPKVWDTYATRDRAEEVAATLKRHGIFAQVRRDDDDQAEAPEHNGDRRRFLVWTVLCGFAKPERLTERIVAEVDSEAAP